MTRRPRPATALLVAMLVGAVLLVASPLAGPAAAGAGARASLELTSGGAGSSSTDAATGTTLDLPRTAGEADQRDDGNTDAAPWVVGSGIAALVAVGVGGLVLKRRAER